MLLENLVTRRVSEENASKSSLTRRVTKQGHLLLAALASSEFQPIFADKARKKAVGRVSPSTTEQARCYILRLAKRRFY